MPKRAKIRGLKSAELLKDKPPFIPDPGNLNKYQKAGYAYERKVAKRLEAKHGKRRVLHNPWIRYVDSKGDGWCCPDVLLLPKRHKVNAVIVECKLTMVKIAERKLRGIYLPVCQMIWPEYEWRMVQIAHNYKKHWKGLILRDLKEIFDEETDWDFASHSWRF